MKASSSVATPRAVMRLRRCIGREHAARIHERYPIAALGLVHEVGRDENGHALIARKIDQHFPEPVPRQGIDARGRLVEDEHFGLVDDGDREREPLANPQRQLQGALIEIIVKAEPFDQRGNTCLRLLRRQVEEVGMKIEVLPDGEFGIERERLRHVADPIARAHVARIEGLPEQQRLALGRRQQAGQHLHGRASCRSRSSRGSRRSRRARW